MSIANSRFENWPDERTATLTRLVAEGMRRRDIAMVLGVTKNAVCGKAIRLGLSVPRRVPEPRRGVIVGMVIDKDSGVVEMEHLNETILPDGNVAIVMSHESGINFVFVLSPQGAKAFARDLVASATIGRTMTTLNALHCHEEYAA